MDFTQRASQATLEKVVKALEQRNIHVFVVENKEAALAKVRELIPAGAEVNNGASTTLEQIGFVDLLKSGQHPWNNLKAAVVAEQDPEKQAKLCKEGILSDYFLGSVHAITEDGELVTASASGSQLPSYAYSSKNVIWVAGTQKIVPTLDKALQRIREYVFPLEDARMNKAMGMGSAINKILIVEREGLKSGRKLHLVLVKEQLGF